MQVVFFCMIIRKFKKISKLNLDTYYIKNIIKPCL